HTVGLRFRGNSPGSIRQNELNTHDIGLLCESNTAIGVQEHPGNQWLGAYSDASARHLGTVFDVLASQYEVQGTPGSILYPAVSSIDVPNATVAQWFVPSAGQAADSCAVDEGCSLYVGEKERTRLDSLLLTGTFESEPAMDWRLKHSLYQKLKVYPGLLTEHLELDSFYNDQTGHTLETLDSLERGHNSMFALTLAEQEAWSANQDSVTMLYADLDEVFEDLHNATTATDSAALFEAFRDLDSLLGVTMATRRAWALQWQEASVLNAMDLTAYGQGASDTLLAADLELQVYQLLLSNVAQGDWVLDSLQLDTLKGIANQCPDIGGPGVLHARAVLSAYQSTSYNDSLLCSVKQLIAQPGNTTIRSEQVAKLKVFPNPAQAQVTLQWAADARQLQVYSAMGQLMAQYPLDEGARMFELSLENYTKGLYFLALQLKDGSSSTIKLIKQ
ncbi:MAG: T9SS type A sorting domain-containing protein, partial [bacterium]|nr:T9SS type A sorting domain-containing protein [bacterium]